MENTSDEIMLAEAHEIFKYLSLDLYNKIPEKIRNFVDGYESKDYHFEYDESKKLTEQNISDQTKDFIGLLHFMFWCSGEEKEELKKILIENEQKIGQEYSAENMSIDNNNLISEQSNLDFLNGVKIGTNGKNYADLVFAKEKETQNALDILEKQENDVSEALIVKQENMFQKIINKIKGFLKNE